MSWSCWLFQNVRFIGHSYLFAVEAKHGYRKIAAIADGLATK
jgi:hypothetical protein